MKRILGMLLLVVVIILSACGMQEKNNNSEKTPSNDKDQLVLLENKEANIKISGIKQPSSDVIGPLIVQFGETSRSFNWENVANETYYPELNVMDLDNDQQQELVIFLTLGYGTGVRESQVHVLRKDYTEIPFPNPLDNAQSKIQDFVTQKGEERVYTITVGEQTSKLTFKEEDAVEWFEQAVVGNSLSYQVVDNEIVAVLSVQVSPGTVLGSLEIPYKLVDGQFIEQPVQFIAFE